MIITRFQSCKLTEHTVILYYQPEHIKIAKRKACTCYQEPFIALYSRMQHSKFSTEDMQMQLLHSRKWSSKCKRDSWHQQKAIMSYNSLQERTVPFSIKKLFDPNAYCMMRQRIRQALQSLSQQMLVLPFP